MHREIVVFSILLLSLSSAEKLEKEIACKSKLKQFSLITFSAIRIFSASGI